MYGSIRLTGNIVSALALMILAIGGCSSGTGPLDETCVLTVEVKGRGTVDPAEGTYSPGTKIILTATPNNTDWYFSNWEGDLVGINSRALLRMDTSKTVRAVFKSDIKYALTITTEGEGTVTPESGSYGIDQELTLTATPSTGWHFLRWGGDLTGTEPTGTVVMDSAKTITAVFEADASEYPLTTSVEGLGTVSPDNGTIAASSSVTLTATPTAGWAFSAWKGDVAGTTNPVTFTMNSSKAVTAIFAPLTSTLTTATEGQGTLAANPAGPTYDTGSSVQLTATPADGWTFDHWSGDLSGTENPTTVTMMSNMTVTAVFVKIQYTLTVEIAGEGTVTPDNATKYDPGTVVTVTATPNPGWDFTTWMGGLGSSPTIQVTMDKDVTVTAFFTHKPYPQVAIETSMGRIVVKLDHGKAPKTVENMIQYVVDGFYDGRDGLGKTIFHRVISTFMIQGGGLTDTLTKKTTRDPITHEGNNTNTRGTIAMARTQEANSATSQFFINVVDNTFPSPGYCVFGEVIEGMDVVDAIKAVATHSVGEPPNKYDDVPVTTIYIDSATVLP